MSENLRCSATKCAFNHLNECKAGAINVKGVFANSSEETRCTSYISESANAFTNSVNSVITKPNNIRCEAYNCLYNDHKNCTALDVRIDAHKANCATFKNKE